MENVTELLDQIRRLMELKGENHFKTRAFEKAAQTLTGRDDLRARAENGTLTELPGIGNAIAGIVKEFLLTGQSTTKDDLEKSLPKGLAELTAIPGLGPKKALVLVEQLGIQSIGELEYACRENRLLNLKGFGVKLQEKILEGIHFHTANQGFQRLSDVKSISEEFLKALRSACPGRQVSETGALRRKLEVLSKLEYLVEWGTSDSPISKEETEVRTRVEEAVRVFQATNPGKLPIQVYFAPMDSFGFELAKTTATPEHWEALGKPALTSPTSIANKTEEDFFKSLQLPFIPPEMRETGEEVTLARQGRLTSVLPWDGIRGVFHNHTTRSDGRASLEEMVCQAIQLGYEYIGISDHSQSAFYAQGLKLDVLAEQEIEIREVRKKHPEIKIFWGIESDILADGSLDYDSAQLSRFDFVIASIHSRFNMDKDAMTARILKAVQNPYTTFLGHPTGRLLLGRKGYEMDMEAILSEAAKCKVAVELNSNPVRLDLDWRWGSAMRKYGTFTSVNPDAHDLEGLTDTQFGVAMARKALLPTGQVINSKTAKEVEQWLLSRKP